MVEAEISRLLSDLSGVAATLNRESDSINDLIKRFEEALCKLNLGLEVWLESDPLDSFECDVEYEVRHPDYHEVGDLRPGSADTQLGFTKQVSEWRVCLREVQYRRVNDGWEKLRVKHYTPVLQATRQLRIKALKHFPALLQKLKYEAEQAIKAIEDAKRIADLC